MPPPHFSAPSRSHLPWPAHWPLAALIFTTSPPHTPIHLEAQEWALDLFDWMAERGVRVDEEMKSEVRRYVREVQRGEWEVGGGRGTEAGPSGAGTSAEGAAAVTSGSAEVVERDAALPAISAPAQHTAEDKGKGKASAGPSSAVQADDQPAPVKAATPSSSAPPKGHSAAPIASPTGAGSKSTSAAPATRSAADKGKDKDKTTTSISSPARAVPAPLKPSATSAPLKTVPAATVKPVAPAASALSVKPAHSGLAPAGGAASGSVTRKDKDKVDAAAPVLVKGMIPSALPAIAAILAASSSEAAGPAPASANKAAGVKSAASADPPSTSAKSKSTGTAPPATKAITRSFVRALGASESVASAPTTSIPAPTSKPAPAAASGSTSAKDKVKTAARGSSSSAAPAAAAPEHVAHPPAAAITATAEKSAQAGPSLAITAKGKEPERTKTSTPAAKLIGVVITTKASGKAEGTRRAKAKEPSGVDEPGAKEASRHSDSDVADENGEEAPDTGDGAGPADAADEDAVERKAPHADSARHTPSSDASREREEKAAQDEGDAKAAHRELCLKVGRAMRLSLGIPDIVEPSAVRPRAHSIIDVDALEEDELAGEGADLPPAHVSSVELASKILAWERKTVRPIVVRRPPSVAYSRSSSIDREETDARAGGGDIGAGEHASEGASEDGEAARRERFATPPTLRRISDPGRKVTGIRYEPYPRPPSTGKDKVMGSPVAGPSALPRSRPDPPASPAESAAPTRDRLASSAAVDAAPATPAATASKSSAAPPPASPSDRASSPKSPKRPREEPPSESADVAREAAPPKRRRSSRVEPEGSKGSEEGSDAVTIIDLTE